MSEIRTSQHHSGSVRPGASRLPDEGELGTIAESVLAAARARGASAAEVSVSVGIGLSVQVRNRAVDTVEHERDRVLAVAVYFGQRQGTASSSDLSPQSVRDTVDAACSIARYTSEDPAQGLADAECMARDIPDLDLDHPWDLETADAIDHALACEAAALDADSRITRTEGAGLNTGRSIRVYANSHGFMGRVTGSRHGLNCVAIAGEGTAMQRDVGYTVDRDPRRLRSPEAVGREAAELAVARQDPRQPATGRTPVLYTPQTARGLIGHFLGAVSGRSLYRRASFLLDTLGQPVFSLAVTLREHPHIPGGLASAAFDSEGVATADRALVEAGVLNGYVLDSYSARKLGMATTGNAGGVHNLTVEPGTLDFQGLLREMGDGVVVTELMGQGVNGVTGDYSRGAAGFLVEGGELAGPVSDFTVAGNLREMFTGIRAVGADTDTRGGVRTGSILVDGVTIAGQ